MVHACVIILPSTYHATLGQNDFDRNVSEELQGYGLWKVSYKISVPATLRNYKKNHIRLLKIQILNLYT